MIETELSSWIATQNEFTQAVVKSTQFKAKSGTFCLITDTQGQLNQVILGLRNAKDFRAFGALPAVLPQGIYSIEQPDDYFDAALGWGMGGYTFTRYKSEFTPRTAQLYLPDNVQHDALAHQLDAIYLGRDLINTPTEDMGPDELEAAVRASAKKHGAQVRVIEGDKLLKENYPSVHAVGRASTREPRVIDVTWGSHDAPKITLVGKGVCFDSGGYDIKTAAGMLYMKKDMAGAAMMLSLAQWIMAAKLPVRLRLLIGAVENLIAGNSYKPGDVIKTRSGKTVEINNTDAEGRVVLCDLLTEACSEKPDLLIDFATLTGAARVALGWDIPAMFTDNDKLAQMLSDSGNKVGDPVWRMPLVQSYLDYFKSDIADMSNCSDIPYGGAITAALYLQQFVDKDIRWAHFDTPAWNFSATPARPVGAEVFAIRAIFDYVKGHYS